MNKPKLEFYKETKFKDTEIGRIPEDWEVVRIKDVAEIIMGQSPPSSTYNTDGVGLPFLQGKAEFGEIYPTPTIYCSKPIKIAKANDILLSVRAPVGDVNIAPFECCIGRGLAAIRTKGQLYFLFLFYYLKLNGKKFEKIASGSTFKAIKKETIENYLIPLPPLEEQKKIAHVLGTIDNAIEIVEKAIEKLERIKKATMEQLLTKGIGHKEFKKVELDGRTIEIPKDWRIAELREITLFIKDGTHNPPKRVEKGIPLLSARNIVNGKIVRFKDDTYITEEDYIKMHSKYEIQKGDVLLTIVGTIGNSAVVDVDYKFTVQRSVAIIRPNTSAVDSYYLHYTFQTSNFKRQLIGCSKLTTQAGVYLKELSRLTILLPPLEEQKQIAKILKTIDEAIELKRKKKEKLERMKKAVMDKLLTGQVRIR